MLDRVAIGFSLTGASLQLYFVGGVLLLVFVYTLKILPVPAVHAARRRTRSPGRSGAGAGLGDPRAAVLRDLRPAVPGADARDAVRGLRPHRARQGRCRSARSTAGTRCAPRSPRSSPSPGSTSARALGGTVITETTFGLQGLGRTAVDAVRQGDLPTIMATVLLAAVFVVVANLVVDLLYAFIDPRVRLG